MVDSLASGERSLRPIVAIIQARMGSTRLPNKVLAEVGGTPVLGHVLERLRLVRHLDRVVVATTTQPRDDVIVAFAEQMTSGVFRGSEEDVLERYVQAAESFGAETIVRICGENVFLQPHLVDQLVELHLKRKPDYTANTIGRTFPNGLYAEVISMEALKRVHQQARLPRHREHVTLYIIDHPEQFRIESIQASGRLRRPEVKLSVDISEDLAFVRTLYRELRGDLRLVHIDAVLDWIDHQKDRAPLHTSAQARESTQQ